MKNNAESRVYCISKMVKKGKKILLYGLRMYIKKPEIIKGKKYDS